MIDFGVLFYIWRNFYELKFGVKHFKIKFGIFFKLKVWCSFFLYNFTLSFSLM